MKINWREALEKYLPEKIMSSLSKIDDETSSNIEEIRLRMFRPLMVYTCEKSYCVNEIGLAETGGIIVSDEDIEQTFSAITGKSAYAFDDDIKQGFITLGSGIRAGIAGSAVQSDGHVKTFRSINGINFRIPIEACGIAKGLIPFISRDKRLLNTLIVSAPKLGKTTLVRDIARCAGNGISLDTDKVSLIDERQEIAASIYGRPLFDVGNETDIISGVPKHLGVFMALRSLSPDVIVTDEIGKSEDLEALREIANAGVVMVTTAHAPDLKSLLNRLFFTKIFDEQLFDAYVILSAQLGRITVKQIHDRMGNDMLKAPFVLKSEAL